MSATADVCRYHHFVALDAVEELSVEPAEDDGYRHGYRHRDDEADAARHAYLYRGDGAEEAGDYPEREAEVQPAARLYHRHHREHEDAVHPDADERIGDRGVYADADEGRCDEERE